MRFSLQTLILATVLLALALAAFGTFGIAIAFILLLADAVGRGQKSKGEAIGCAVVTAICSLILICPVLLPFILESTSHGVRRLQCQNNLKQLSLALQEYYLAHGCFAPAYIPDKDGKPMHSWRVLILPYVGCDRIYHQYNFNEPWNGPHNRRLAARVPNELFICPSSEAGRDSPGTTNYFAVVGRDTAWPGAKSFCLDDFDGDPATTILLVEVENSDINWMEPRDLSLEEALAKTDSESVLAINAAHPGTNVALLDGSVQCLPEQIEAEELESLLRTDRDGKCPRLEPSPPKSIWPRVAAALAFLVVFILYVIRRNKDAAAFAAREATNQEKNPDPPARTEEQTAGENRAPDRPE